MYLSTHMTAQVSLNSLESFSFLFCLIEPLEPAWCCFLQSRNNQACKQVQVVMQHSTTVHLSSANDLIAVHTSPRRVVLADIYEIKGCPLSM